MKEGSVVLLNNVRNHKEEKQNDKVFGKKLASLGDFFVNDTFAVSHRKTRFYFSNSLLFTISNGTSYGERS